MMQDDDDDEDPAEMEMQIQREEQERHRAPLERGPRVPMACSDDDEEDEEMDDATRAMFGSKRTAPAAAPAAVQQQPSRSSTAAGKRPMAPPPRQPPVSRKQARGAFPTVQPRARPGATGYEDDEHTDVGESVIDSDDEEEEDEEEEEEEEEEEGEHGSHGEHGQAEQESEGGTNNGNDRLRASLDKMPGWRAMIMGSGIRSLPAAFETALPGHWIQWTNTGQPFKKGEEPIDARTLCMHAKKRDFANDGQRLGDFETHNDPVQRASSVTTAALWGMLTTGTSKGWLCSPNHTELNTAKVKEMEGEELDKHKKKLQGNMRTYTYQPNAKSADVTLRNDTAMQFAWSFEEIYNPAGTEVLFYRILKHIYDHGHSDDELWRQLMDESGEITRAGSINGIPEALRKQWMLQQNKLQRTQINDDDMQNTASTQYKRITTMTDLIKFYKVYSGKCDGSGGRPLYANIRADTPIGCQAKAFSQSKDSGGEHPLGPSVAFNFKRFLAPDVIAPGHPGVNVATAGCVDDAGNPVEIHPSQADPNNYYDAEGRFRPPEWVRKKGCFFMCHDVNMRNIFNLPFPRPVHGSVVPEDCLLERYWDLHKDSDPALVAAIERGAKKDPPRTEFRHHKDLVGTLFHNMTKQRDETARKISEGVLDTEMLTADSIDKSAAEQERLNNHKCYGRKVATKDGDRYVLEPQQILCDLAEEQERVHSMIQQWDANARTDIQAQGAAAQKERAYFDRATADAQRSTKHCAAVDACVKLGLRRFENAFASKKLSSSIPPGWKDVAHKGLKDALKAAAEVGMRRSSTGTGRRVDPNDPKAATGTANIAFAHGRKAQAQDLSPFGHWRAFLIHLFSSGVKVSGPDVRVMLECAAPCTQSSRETCPSLLVVPCFAGVGCTHLSLFKR